MRNTSSTQLAMSTDSMYKMKPSSWNKRGTSIVVLLGVAVAALVIGLLVGHFAIDKEESCEPQGIYLEQVPERLVTDGNPEIADLIKNAIDPKRIREYLREITKTPHIAGRPGDFRVVDLIQRSFKDSGLTVQTTPYDVLLSYPNRDVPNTVRLLDSSNHVVYDSLRDESNFSKIPDVVPPFLAYSPSKLVVSDMVFVNFARVEDFVWLRDNRVDVTGKIVIARYGRIFRGDKVANAAHYGAAGCILYTDPIDCTGMAQNDTRVYPDTWWLPPTGVQRGSIFIGTGDPITPGYPSNNLAYRHGEDDTDPPLPSIPAHAITYGAAYHFLKELGGPAAPPEWQGGLNITYNLGPGFKTPGMKAQLNVTCANERAKAENVFGIIKGEIEPDRYVLLGNHRDAWIYGAIDPSSGTAVMLELARVMGDLVRKGKWRPRRTIIFCSWGAEEYGLLGSSEWVENYVASLRERAVGYINVDIAVLGNDTIKAAGTPLMYKVIYEATKKVANPSKEEVAAGRTTVYDTWLKVRPWPDVNGRSTGVPAVSSLGSGSDYAPFLQRAGITSLDIRYTFDWNRFDIPGYPLYHSEYETFRAFVEQFDRDFQYSTALSHVCTELLLSLGDSLVLPFNVSDYAKGLDLHRRALDGDSGPLLRRNLPNYHLLEEVIANFSTDVAEFEERRHNLNLNNPFLVRQVNDQIMLLERAFLIPEGLPSRPQKKHIVFAENAKNAYAPSSFPGIVDLLYEIDQHPENWELVKQHFAALLQTIQSAGATMRDVTYFMSETL